MSRVMPDVTDERLAWLLVRDELAMRTKSTPWWTLLKIFGATRGATGTARAAQDELVSGRMADYGLAVDDAAETLSAEERRTLRASGTLPEWFMADVDRRYQAIRKSGR